MSVTAQLADGRTLEFPDGTDPAVVQATVKKMIAGSPQEDPTSAKNILGAATEPMMHLASGAAAGPIAGLAGLVSPLTNALGVTHTDPADVVRKIESGLTYEPRTTGGKNATEAITYPLRLLGEGADRAGGAVSDVAGPAAGTAVNTAIQALPRLLGMKAGAAIPASRLAPPLTGGIIDSLYRVIEPRLENGPADVLTRFQRNLAGPDAVSKVVAALQNAKEIVPGSAPTAAEALADIPEASPLAAHQRAVSKTPEASADFVQRAQDQSAARNAALDTVAQTPEALNAAVDARDANAALDYASAFHAERSGIPTLPTRGLEQIQKNPYFQDALPAANKLAEVRGITPEANLSEYLHLVKLSLDQMLERQGDTALGRADKSAVQDVKSQLVDWLGKNNPGYNEARANFAQASSPINQMQVGQYLSDKLNSPLEQERPGSFAQAARDAPGTIQRAAGGPRFQELSDVLTPQQAAVVDAIQGDLSRGAQANKLASATSLGGASPLGGSVNLPHMLSRPITTAEWLMRTMKGADAVEPVVNKLAGQQYLDPVQLANSLTRQTTQEAIIEALLRARNPAILGAAGAAGER